MILKMMAPCHFGLEKTLSFEIKRAGGTDVSVSDGRIVFFGDEYTLAKINMTASTAERIGIVLAEFKANTFDDVYHEVKKIPIYNFLTKNDKFPVVKGQSLNSKLTSIPAIQRTVKKALAESMATHYNVSLLPEDKNIFPVRFFLYKDNMTVYLDSSGVGLHKRGYRAESGTAPIKETLAAGLIDIARVKKDGILIDPLCGSGTILIEGAFKALNIPPSFNRTFQAMSWEVIPLTVWEEVRESLKTQIIKDSEFRAYGFDNDDRAIELSKSNAQKAGVSDYITFQKRDICDFQYPTDKAKVITNPPYADRLLEQAEAEELYKTMGRVLFPLNGNEVYVINGNETFETFLGQKAHKNRKLYNGMLMCRYYQYI